MSRGPSPDAVSNTGSAPATRPIPAYRARAGAPERERATVLKVWRSNLGDDAHMPRKYDWFYLHAPAGEPLLHVLEHRVDEPSTPAMVGVGAIGRRRMLYRGAPVRAGVLVDLAVLPEHRSLGPAMILGQTLFAAGRERLDLFYGFPNPKATPVFKRIGYRTIGEMIRYVRVLRCGPYLRRAVPARLAPLSPILAPALDLGLRARDAWRWRGGPRFEARWSTRAPDVAALWADSSKPDALVAVRDERHLRWRFDEAPDAAFQHLSLGVEGEMRAWFAARSEGHTLQIHDFWLRGSGAQADAATIAALLTAARAAGYAAVSVELATSPERLRHWLALGFEARDRRPIYGYADSSIAAADAPLDLHLTAADEDE